MKFRCVRVAAVILATTAAVAPVARAGEPTAAELLERIEALEKEVRDLKKGAAPCEPKPATEAPAAAAEPPVKPVTARRIEPDQSTSTAVEPGPPSKPKVLAGYDEGFFIASPDGAYKLRINGFVQSDARFFIDNKLSNNRDQFVIRRARLDLRAKLWKRFTLRLSPDFAGSQLDLRYACLDTEFTDWLTLRSGKQKTPYGIEQLVGATDLPVVERALTDNLVPNRDIGLQAFGHPFGGRLEYSLAVMNGAPDGGSVDGDTNDAIDVVARIFATPYAPSTYSPLRGLGFGIATTWGKEHGSASSPQLSEMKTTGRATFFEYEDDGTVDGTTVAGGDRWRISPQARWYEGPVGVLTEYDRTTQQLRLDRDRERVTNQAWQIRASWAVTGEHVSSKRIVPDEPFDFGGGHWGAWELMLRWSSLDVDGDVFEHGFADPGDEARHADALGAAVNWYLNRNVSMYLQYEHTTFGGGDGSGDRPDENVFTTRMQMEF